MARTDLRETDPDPLPAGVDPGELAEIALTVAGEAAHLIVAERPRDLGVAETKSSATDIVTVMDQRSQDLLLARLGELRPQDGFAGEERGGRTGSPRSPGSSTRSTARSTTSTRSPPTRSPSRRWWGIPRPTARGIRSLPLSSTP